MHNLREIFAAGAAPAFSLAQSQGIFPSCAHRQGFAEVWRSNSLHRPARRGGPIFPGRERKLGRPLEAGDDGKRGDFCEGPASPAECDSRVPSDRRRVQFSGKFAVCARRRQTAMLARCRSPDLAHAQSQGNLPLRRLPCTISGKFSLAALPSLTPRCARPKRDWAPLLNGFDRIATPRVRPIGWRLPAPAPPQCSKPLDEQITPTYIRAEGWHSRYGSAATCPAQAGLSS